MTSIAKADFAMAATLRPMPPKPTTPRTLPDMSDRAFRYLKSKSTRRVAASAPTIRFAAASISAMVCSATEARLASGVFTTGIPSAVACSTAIALTQTPCEPITRSDGAASIACALKPALRVMIETASHASAATVAISARDATRGVRPAARRSSSPTGWIGCTIRQVLMVFSRRIPRSILSGSARDQSTRRARLPAAWRPCRLDRTRPASRRRAGRSSHIAPHKAAPVP